MSSGGCDLSSSSVAHYNLRSLMEKGKIIRSGGPYAVRSMRLPGATVTAERLLAKLTGHECSCQPGCRECIAMEVLNETIPSLVKDAGAA